jgi:apolipoprotein N-acyltransferase
MTVAEFPVWLRRLPQMPLALGLAFIAGALLTLSFAPHDLWFFAVICPAVLMLLWSHAAAPRTGFRLGFAFGLGTFSFGTWWLYISIHGFGQAPMWVALLVMGALVLIMSLYYGLLGWTVVRFLPAQAPLGWLVAIPAAWVLLEWWRGWFLSGFPWLSLGYSQTDTWLAGFAPVGGVHLVSVGLLVGAGALVTLVQGRSLIDPSARRHWRGIALAALLLPWLGGAALRTVQWTIPDGTSADIAIVQGAIPQDMKWLDSNHDHILDVYADLNRDALGAKLIVWPESALPDFANQLAPWISGQWSVADQRGSALVLGVMRIDDSGERFYNSVLALGDGAPQFYDKQHLVPFGEYFPVPAMVREWLRLMSLPNSDFDVGAANPRPLNAGGLRIAASICYEDAYPGTLRATIRDSQLLVNVTNDAWFGRSAARYQHLQISRMRAIESRRPLLRAANDGVSAVIAPDGRIVSRAAEFMPLVLRTSIEPRSGDTPYLRLGNFPVMLLAVLALVASIWRVRKLPADAGVSSVNFSERNSPHDF